MKRVTYSQIRVVEGDDAKTFQDEFNKAQTELKSMKPETIKLDLDAWVAVIQFTVETEEPENARERFESQGVRFTCENCPRFQPMRNNDGSVKRTAVKGSCFKEAFLRRDTVACDFFYAEVENGAIEPVRGGIE